MKKFVLIFIMIIFTQLSSVAKPCFTCQDIPETPNSASIIISKITGVNFCQVKGTEIAVEKYIKRKYNNKVNININAKSAKALKNGEFKEVSIKAKDFRYGLLSFSEFSGKSLCPYNKVVQRGRDYYFPYDIPVQFNATMTNDDLLYIANTDKFQNIIKSFSIPLYGIDLIRISDIDWKIQNDKLRMMIEAHSPFSLGIPVRITLTSGLSVSDGKVTLLNPTRIGSSIKVDVNKILPSLNIYNPLSYVLHFAGNSQGKVFIDNVSIRNDKIYLSGIFLIPKNCDITK